VTLRNYYLEEVLDGALVFRAGTVVGALGLAALLVLGVVR
jgi:hypothetical protein